MTLQVDTIGLRMLAAHCESWAAEVAATSDAESHGLPCQATTAAVSAVHAGIEEAAHLLVTRMHSTAAKLNTASAAYRDGDQAAADRLSATLAI